MIITDSGASVFRMTPNKCLWFAIGWIIFDLQHSWDTWPVLRIKGTLLKDGLYVTWVSMEVQYRSCSNGSVILSKLTHFLFSCQVYCFSTRTAWKIVLDSCPFYFFYFSSSFFGLIFQKRSSFIYIDDNMADSSGKVWNIFILTTEIWSHHIKVRLDYDVNLTELIHSALFVRML